MGQSAVQLDSVAKSYDEGVTYAVQDFSLEIAPGEFVALLGESGSGKTTLLKTINRLIEVSRGRVLVGGKDVQDRDPVQLRREIGYVFQEIGLFPHLTIGSNIGVVPRLLGWKRQEEEERIDELLNMVGLDPDEYRDRLPQQLSGGQQQRVGLARSLAARPELLLMDEPFGALDPLTRALLQREYLELHRELELTSLMVTHDVAEAFAMADRVGVMQEGRLLQAGTPQELLQNPAEEYVDELLKAPLEPLRRLSELSEEGEA